MSRYVNPWVNLTDFASNFDDDNDLLTLISEGLVSLRGRIFDEGQTVTRPHTEIPLLYILNATIDIDRAVIKARSDFDVDDKYVNQSAFVEVEANALEFAALLKSKKFTEKRGRPRDYDQDAIALVFRKFAATYKGSSFAGFVRERSAEIAAASGKGRAPDRTWLHRHFHSLYEDMRRK